MPPRSRIKDLSADPEVAGRQARDLCLRMLTDRARTRQELADALTAEGVPESVIRGVLDRLEELGLLDDSAYADAFVRSRIRSGQARRVIERDLRTRGVSEQVAAEALEQVDGDHERAAALRLATVRAGRIVGLPEPVRRRRLYGFLARRGYPSELVASVVEEALGAAEATESVTG
jgi:regulatory protein